MKEDFNNIDDIFNKGLIDYQEDPSDDLWSKIESKLPQKKSVSSKSFLGNRKKYFFLAFLLLLAISAIIFFNLNNNPNKNEKINSIKNVENNIISEKVIPENEKLNETVIKNNNEAKIIAVAENKNVINNESVNKTASNYKQTNKKELVLEKISQKENISNNTIVLNTNNDEYNSGIADVATKSNPENNNSKNEQNVPEISSENTNHNEGNKLDTNIVITNTDSLKIIDELFSDTLINDIADNNIVTIPKVNNTKGVKSKLSYGLNLDYENFYYSDSQEKNLRNNSWGVDLVAKYNFPKFTIQSGVGLSFSADDAGYKINYISIDFVDTFNLWDSIPDNYILVLDSTIVIDSNQYYTHYFYNAYDSVNHIKYNEGVNHYTHLNIPLLFGYKYDYKKMSFTIKGGALFSFVIYKNIPFKNNTLNEDQFFQGYHDKISTRSNFNLRFMTSLECAYNINDKISVFVEPKYSYYFNSVYTTGNPYNIGLKAGINFKF